MTDGRSSLAAAAQATAAREIGLLRRRGRLVYLLRAVAKAALIVVGGVATYLAFSTALSWYPGTGASTSGPTETTVVARVESCTRVGPVSGQGFGYWWECRIAVPATGGGTRTEMVFRSIVSPSDVGRDVELQQACSGGNCVYGRRVPWLVTTAFLAGRIIDRLVSILFACLALLWLARGIAPERYWAFMSKRAQKWWPDRGGAGAG